MGSPLRVSKLLTPVLTSPGILTQEETVAEARENVIDCTK